MLLPHMKKLLVLIPLCFLLLPATASAAIALDSAKFGADAAGSISWSHTVSGSNTILFVTTLSHTNSASDPVSAVTYDGVAMAKAGPTLTWLTNGSVYFNQTVWWLTAPHAGTHTVSVTAVGSPETGGASQSYTGVDQTSPIDAYSSQTDASGVNPSVSVTTTADNAWTIAASTGPCALATAGSGSTIRASGQPSTFDSNGAITPAGPTTMHVNYSGLCGTSGSVIVSVAPVSAPAPLNSILSLVKAFWIW